MMADEKFFAWLDGELNAPEAAEMEARVSGDPELARLAEQHRALGSRIKSAFDPIAEAPVPQEMTDAVCRPPAEVIDFAAVKQARDKRHSWASASQWAAIAATLVIGVLVGTQLPRHGSTPAGTPPIAVQDGAIYAAASLDRALNTQLASAPSASAVRVGLTFRDQTGAICRSFTETKASGLACRSGDRWQVRGLFAAPEGQSEAYRMAAGMDPDLAALVDSTISGDPFDAAQEKAAQSRGWK